jgi:hypothetical protein
MSTCGQLDKPTRNSLLAATLNEEQARALYQQGEEAVVFALLELAKRLAEVQAKADPSISPSTPSGMVPTYQKPASRPGKKKRGAKKGHPGSRRQVPERIDWQAKHRANLGACKDFCVTLALARCLLCVC